MEAQIMSAIQKGATGNVIISLAFFYLLFYLVKENRQAMLNVASSLETFGKYLKDVSDTLLKIDMRVEHLEQRIKDLEREGKK